jgi:hypothetical protein
MYTMTFLNNFDSMLDLSEEELASVNGAEFLDGLAACGLCGAAVLPAIPAIPALGACGACGIGGFAAIPAVTAFSNVASNAVSFNTSFATSRALQNTFFNIVS